MLVPPCPRLHAGGSDHLTRRSSSFWTQQIIGKQREGEAPAELFTYQARQEPRTPDEIASNSEGKAVQPPSR